MPRTVLIVDDHLSLRTLIKEYLTTQGYRVVTAADGQDALTVARVERPDLILLDVMMPTLDGFDFMRTLRANDRTRDVPVVAISAAYPERAALDLGVQEFIAKPFDVSALVAAVRRATGEDNASEESPDPTTLPQGA
jgi:DNA-binding response OmpR family regulator